MRDTPPAAAPGWTPFEVGGELALAREAAGVRFLFGLGPASGHGSPGERAQRVLVALAPQLAALRWCRQVHGARLTTVEAIGDEPLAGASCTGEGDGLTAGEAGVGLVVWTADCVPVLLAGAGALAAVHAGWRGAAAGVVTAAVRHLSSRHGVAPAELYAFLGPAVGPCHYPVGPEVITALGLTGIGEERWRSGERVDLRALLAAELERAGVRRVARVGPCTACCPELASYRRDGASAGRQLSLLFRPVSGSAPARASLAPAGRSL